MIDLHTHTTVSDGTLTPTELVHRSKAGGITTIAVTDHDILDGLDEAMAVGEAIGVRVIPGVELSADSASGSMHILGYFIDHRDTNLRERLERLRSFRDQRNPRIVERLNQLGIDISYDDVLEKAGAGTVGRPHVASVLVEKGYVKSVSEAFERYLEPGAPAYVDKKRPDAAEAIALIRSGGGLAVLAHPVRMRATSSGRLPQLLGELAAAGLEGLEVYHSDHSASLRSELLALAEGHGLLVFGGSDFHGANKPGIELGTGRGDLHIPISLLEPIEHRVRMGRASLTGNWADASPRSSVIE